MVPAHWAEAVHAMLPSQSGLQSEEIGWIIVIIFVMLLAMLVTTAVWKVISHCYRRRRYAAFLCHAKSGAGLFARLVKMVMESMMKR